MKSLNETIREGETKKRQLEESLDALQEEVSGTLFNRAFFDYSFDLGETSD
jgi:hypothetical protein